VTTPTDDIKRQATEWAMKSLDIYPTQPVLALDLAVKTTATLLYSITGNLVEREALRRAAHDDLDLYLDALEKKERE